MMKKGLLLVMILLFVAGSAKSEGIEGKWKTIDDVTGEVKSIVEITIKDGLAYGTIIQLFNEDPNYDPDCKACKGDLKNEKIIGMQIINGLKLLDGKWVGRKGVLDPDNGKYYKCKLWLNNENPNKLNIRGYISFFYRAQTWMREK